MKTLAVIAVLALCAIAGAAWHAALSFSAVADSTVYDVRMKYRFATR